MLDLQAEIETRVVKLEGTPSSVDVEQLVATFVDLQQEQPEFELFAPVQLDHIIFTNDTDAPGNQTWSVSKRFSARASVTVQKGVSIGRTCSFNLPIPNFGGGVTFSETITTSTSETKVSETGQDQTFSQTFFINIAPRTKVDAICTVTPQQTSIRFAGKLRVHGSAITHHLADTDVEIKMIGGAVGKWRTKVNTPFEYPIGRLFRDVGCESVHVLDDQTVEVPVQGIFRAVLGTAFEYRATGSAIRYPAGAGAGTERPVPVQKLEKVTPGGAPQAIHLETLLPRADDGEIGAPDGVTYVVESTCTVVKPDPVRCGFNDLSLPNHAQYSREVRRYSEYRNGDLVRSWTEEAETFLGCVQV